MPRSVFGGSAVKLSTITWPPKSLVTTLVAVPGPPLPLQRPRHEPSQKSKSAALPRAPAATAPDSVGSLIPSWTPGSVPGFVRTSHRAMSDWRYRLIG